MFKMFWFFYKQNVPTEHKKSSMEINQKLHLLHLFAFKDAIVQNSLFEIISMD